MEEIKAMLKSLMESAIKVTNEKDPYLGYISIDFDKLPKEKFDELFKVMSDTINATLKDYSKNSNSQEAIKFINSIYNVTLTNESLLTDIKHKNFIRTLYNLTMITKDDVKNQDIFSIENLNLQQTLLAKQ